METADAIGIKDGIKQRGTTPFSGVTIYYSCQETGVSGSVLRGFTVPKVHSILRFIFPFSKGCVIATVPFLFEDCSQTLS